MEAYSNGSNCSFYHYEYVADDELHSLFENVKMKVVEVIYTCIFCIGSLANLAVVVLFLFKGRNSIVRTFPSSIIVFNLAVADLLFLIGLPFSVSQRVYYQWKFGLFGCKLINFVKFYSHFAAVFFLVLLAFDRYFSVNPPLSYKSKKNGKVLVLVCLSLWILAGLINIPTAVFSRINDGICIIEFSTLRQETRSDPCEYPLYLEFYYDTDLSSETDPSENFLNKDRFDWSFDSALTDYRDRELHPQLCHHPSTSFQAWLISNFVLGFVIPYLLIFMACYKRKKFFLRSSLRLNNDLDFIGRETRSSETFCLMTTGFVLWIPFHIWHLIQIPGINVDARTCFTIRDVTFCVAFMNSALNPIFTTFFLTKTAQIISTSSSDRSRHETMADEFLLEKNEETCSILLQNETTFCKS